MRLPESRFEIPILLPFEYDEACAAFAGDEDALPWWQELGDVLMRRPGWYFSISRTFDGIAPLWAFGMDGEARLTIYAEVGGWIVFEYDEESKQITRRDLLLDWLHEHEDANDGLSPLALNLRASLRRMSENRLPESGL